MKHTFDPSQETFEEYLRRISIGPWSADNDVIYMDHGHTEKRRKTEGQHLRADHDVHQDYTLSKKI